MAPGSQSHSEKEGRKEGSKKGVWREEGGMNGIRNIYRRYLYVQSSAHSIARGNCWQHINHNTLLNKRTVFVAVEPRRERREARKLPGAHTHTIPSATISATCHVFAKNSSCSPRLPPALATVDTLFIFVRFCCQRNTATGKTFFRHFWHRLAPVSVTPYECVCVWLCVCAAHQIKQSQRTAVSCTATKETKNKFALRANELSAGGRQNNRTGGVGRATYPVEPCSSTCSEALLCVTFLCIPWRNSCLLVKLNLNSNLNTNSCTNFKFVVTWVGLSAHITVLVYAVYLCAL